MSGNPEEIEDIMNPRRGSTGPPAASKSGASARPAAASPAAGSPARREIGAALLCAAVALLVQRHALGGFFSADDLVLIEQFRGLVPRTVTLWRAVSGTLWFGSSVALFGLHPFPYHLASWLLHGVNVVLLYALARSLGGGPIAACLAASLFGAAPLSFVALHQAASVGELLALGLTLAALLAVTRHRVAGAALFGAALLSKENVLLLPLARLAPGGIWGPRAARLRALLPLLALSLAFVFYAAVSGLLSRNLGGEAYEMALGANVARNLTAYCAMALDLIHPVPDASITGVPGFSLAGVLALIGLVALALATARRSALPAFGVAWWLLGLLPVLPLVRQLHLYYAYAPSAGLGLALGAALEIAILGLTGSGASAGSRLARAICLVLVLAFAWRADALVAERLRARVPGLPVAQDRVVRKSEAARRAIEEVRGLIGDSPAKLAFFPADGTGKAYLVREGDAQRFAALGSAPYYLVEGVLDEGRALKLFFPRLDSVVFLETWSPGYRDFQLLTVNPEGRIENLGTGPAAHAEAAVRLLRNRHPDWAKDYLAQVLTVYPDDTRLRLSYCFTLLELGDSTAALREVDELLRRAPGDSLARRAREVLTGKE